MKSRLPTLGGPEPRIPTPCISVCKIDPFEGMCTGCLRTLEEIAAWSRMSQEQRQEIMASLEARKAQVPKRHP